MAKEAKKKENKNNSTASNVAKKGNKKEKRHFLKDVKAELKKVIWPTPKQLFNNTVAVIVIALIVGIIVFLLDVCFEKMNSFGVEKLKSIVQSVENNETTENNESSEDVEENSDASDTVEESTTEDISEQVEDNPQDTAEDANGDNVETVE